VLPLRDVVLFPGVTLPLFVGRPKSIAAIESVLADGGLFLALTQKRADLVDPSGPDLQRVGSIACVREHTTLPDGTYRVVVSGLFRARLKRIALRGGFLEASLSAYPDADPPSGEEEGAQVVREEVVRLFEEYAQLRERLGVEIIETARKLLEPSAFTLFVAGHVATGVNVRQRLLATEGWLPRLKDILEILSEDVRVLRLEKRGRAAAGRVRMEPERPPDPKRPRLPEPQPEEDDELAELRTAITSTTMPEAVRTKATRELVRLTRMNPMSPEATVSRTYLDWLIAIPWSKRSPDRLDLTEAEESLDRDHYGLRKVKDRILEHIAVFKLSGSMRGPVLCLLGPPGVGKTSLGRSIATALGRKFVRMSLGGVRDEAEVRGHRRTYIGSMPGRIVQAMRTAGTVNPLILLDEIDKIGSDYRGDPAAALLEVLDPEQNHAFRDHYLDLEYDLSNVMFVTTANGRGGIQPALLDRMELLNLPGYLEHEKLSIARGYLLPRQMERAGLTEKDLQLSQPALIALIQEWTREAGVRSLEREIAGICRKAARRRADGGSHGSLVVTRQNLASIMGPPKYTPSEVITRDRVGVATGLAWTEVGGVILNVEVALLPGRGRLILTGQLGETMQESGQAALSYIRSRSAMFGLDEDFTDRHDIHVHMAQGGVPKDGPSAGITMALALVSALTGTPTRADVALTGEITLRGTVLPVGGLPEKLMAARRAGIRVVLVPQENIAHVEELPKQLTRNVTIVPVTTMDEVIEHGLDGRVPAGKPLGLVGAH
jgi:ATP-dependent Lon protease